MKRKTPKGYKPYSKLTLDEIDGIKPLYPIRTRGCFRDYRSAPDCPYCGTTAATVAMVGSEAKNEPRKLWCPTASKENGHSIKCHAWTKTTTI